MEHKQLYSTWNLTELCSDSVVLCWMSLVGFCCMFTFLHLPFVTTASNFRHVLVGYVCLDVILAIT